MGDVNLEIKLSNLDERVTKIEDSGGGGESYISSVTTDFNVVNKKLSLSSLVTEKLSKLNSIADGDENDGEVTQKLSEITEELTDLSNATRRTKRNITSNLANLPTAIAEQNLEKYGYTIGDYFVGASGYYYYLADMNTNYGGYNNQAVVSTPHCGIVVDTKGTCQWLSSGTVTNYSSSTLHSFLNNTALPVIKNDIKALFGNWENHLIARTELDNAIGGGGTTWDGLKNCLICAMTEVQIYGARVFGVDGFQTGTGSKQLELFRKFRFNEIFGNIAIWLKSLYSASQACYAGNVGIADRYGVANSLRASGLILFH